MSVSALRRRVEQLERSGAAARGVVLVPYEILDAGAPGLGPDAISVAGQVSHRGADESGEQLLRRVSDQQARAAGAVVCLLAGPLDQRL